MDYKPKYLKYKTKYIQKQNQFGGVKRKKNNKHEKHNDENHDEKTIIEFINNSSIAKIKEALPKLLHDTITYCDKIIGRGMMGEVTISAIGKTVDVKVNSVIIKMPVVIKKAYNQGIFEMNVIEDKLYISSYMDITTEAIILLYVSKLWYKKLSPHLPFMIGFGKCEPNNNMLVDRIITEKHGLEKEIEIKINGLNQGPFWHPDPTYNWDDPSYKTNFATMGDLLSYVCKYQNNGSITLPNKRTCNIFELFDYLTISYLCTHDMLFKNNILLSDMHPGNIFIHWLNPNSYMGDTNLENIKHIIYKIDGKYIKIDTFGLLLKIGDIGASILHLKSDVFILGQGVDLNKSYNVVKYIMKNSSGCHNFLYNFKYMLPFSLYSKTIAFKILSTYPYSEISGIDIDYKLMNDFLSPIEMLKYFTKYFIKNPKKSLETLIV